MYCLGQHKNTKEAPLDILRPHDLLWVDESLSLFHPQGLPEWVSCHWHPALPLVVRRDEDTLSNIPVGIRGSRRCQRAAAWIKQDAIVKVVTPESLIADIAALQRSPFAHYSPILTLIQLHRDLSAWRWGITGSCGYALATGIDVMHQDSDLDLVIFCPHPVLPSIYHSLSQRLQQFSCRVDVQIETPFGAFALNEWLRDGCAMLKTSRGPRLTDNPWHPLQETP
ncbi:malonate decarboxylase holo-ACP synthase [Providencia burhodogranariea]|uniref:Phosphoribosyl-dephospho-CoA transferase n=1 Tax=Providencia burhodogranariea DSM 19968 TaxID=1141662 RepID=K8WSK5_9GAMM|nr:phosphoribosyl-dephospho-CoA transferase [Providencia burhodogranariea DSM 19968]